MSIESIVGPWTPTDIQILSDAAKHCLREIEAGQAANPNSQRLTSRRFLEAYLAHLVDPEYLMPLSEDKKFFSYVLANDHELYMTISPSQDDLINL